MKNACILKTHKLCVQIQALIKPNVVISKKVRAVTSVITNANMQHTILYQRLYLTKLYSLMMRLSVQYQLV